MGEALKGPAAKMMSELGEQVSCAGVARRYQGLCDVLVMDKQDAHEMTEVSALGIRPIVMDTMMVSMKKKERLARDLVDLTTKWHADR